MKRVIYVLVLVLILCACGSQSAQPIPTPDLTATAIRSDAATAAALETASALTPLGQPTPTPQPTNPPTDQPTTAPTTAVKPVSGYPDLGADIGTFVMRYGQPNDHTDITSGQYHFQRYPGSNIDELMVDTDIADGFNTRVDDITVAASDAGNDTGWTQEQASANCGAFFPRDAVHKRRVDTNDGYDEIYFSASLVALFPASSFSDGNGNTVQAGLFDVFYLYRSSPMIDSCDMIIGTQQTTS